MQPYSHERLSNFLVNGSAAMNLELQCELFSAALDEIGNVDQLVNEVIEVDLETPEAEITIRRYTLPG